MTDIRVYNMVLLTALDEKGKHAGIGDPNVEDCPCRQDRHRIKYYLLPHPERAEAVLCPAVHVK